MSHAALVNGALFWFVVVLTLLLAMFIYAVIAMPSEDAVPAEPPALTLPPPPRPSPARRPPASTPPEDAFSQPRDVGYAPRHAGAAAPAQNGIHPPGVPGSPQRDPVPHRDNGIHRPEVSGGPPWGPAPKPPGLD
jgi:hypothetical protein